jgi:hypothetical protein
MQSDSEWEMIIQIHLSCSDTEDMQIKHSAEALTNNDCILIEHSSLKQHKATKNNIKIVTITNIALSTTVAIVTYKQSYN